MKKQKRTPKPSPVILVIIGISGDLATRKLIPAIRTILNAGAVPQQFRLIGVTRRKLAARNIISGKKDALARAFELYQMDLSDLNAYKTLEEHIAGIERSFGAKAQRLFYLALPPQTSRGVIEMLGRAGFAQVPETKLLLEKPFGVDLASAKELVASISTYFIENQVYRIDHYLAKEMAQNLLVFRMGNSLFRRTWNNAFIESVTITASETIGIEGRAAFYEQTGAVRDFVQSHLLQLAAIILMELPKLGNLDHIPAKRERALAALEIDRKRDGTLKATRGQYTTYRKEVGNKKSMVETFVSIELRSTNPHFRGVPIILTTGKALDRKATEITIHYRKEDSFESNELTLRIQPDEGVEIAMWAKRPGYDRTLERHVMNFSYGEHYDSLPDAYERVLLDAIRGDHSFFVSGEEVLASWNILEPLRKKWEMSADGLVRYKPGSSINDIVGDALQ